MKKAEILREIPNLTREERDELRLALAELDGGGWDDIDDPLSPAEKALLDQRFAELEKNPGASIPWQSAVDRLRERFPGELPGSSTPECLNRHRASGVLVSTTAGWACCDFPPGRRGYRG